VALFKDKVPESQSRKVAHPAPAIQEEDEDVGLNDGPPLLSHTRRSGKRTRDAEQPPKIPSMANLTPLMRDLEACNEKLRITFSE
jgi:hypothetical protein